MRSPHFEVSQGLAADKATSPGGVDCLFDQLRIDMRLDRIEDRPAGLHRREAFDKGSVRRR
jgi:hypothetical protein